MLNKTSRYDDTEMEIKRIKEETMKEKQNLNKKIEFIRKQKNTQICSGFNKKECLIIKKQGEETVEKQKIQNKELANTLSKLENEFSCLQVYISIK